MATHSLQWLLYCFRFPTWNLFFIYNCWKNKEVLFFDQSRSSLIQIIKRFSGNFLWFLAYQSGKMFFAWSGKGFDISSVLNSIVFLLNDWDIIMMDFSLETIICWCSILIWRVLQSPYGMFFAVQCQHSLVATLVFFVYNYSRCCSIFFTIYYMMKFVFEILYWDVFVSSTIQKSESSKAYDQIHLPQIQIHYLWLNRWLNH